MYPGDPDQPPDSLAPTTLALDEPEDPVLLELIQRVDEVIALRGHYSSDIGTVERRTTTDGA